jgi:hypothetical protein
VTIPIISMIKVTHAGQLRFKPVNIIRIIDRLIQLRFMETIQDALGVKMQMTYCKIMVSHLR